MCLIYLKIRHFPIPTHIQIHTQNTAIAATIIRQVRKKFGVMKPSVWMIWKGSNTRRLNIFMATSYISYRTAWQNAQRLEKRQRKQRVICCVNEEYHQWCESGMFRILCFHSVYLSAWQRYQIQHWHCFIAPPAHTSWCGNHILRLVILLLNAAFRCSVPS
jgi:hypothetical protein